LKTRLDSGGIASFCNHFVSVRIKFIFYLLYLDLINIFVSII
jgi:hypothetical protein